MLNDRSKWSLALAIALSLGIGAWAFAQDKDKAKTEKPATEEEKKAAVKDASYAFGFQVGLMEGQKGFPAELVDYNEFVEGMKAALRGDEGRVNNDRYAAAAKVFQSMELERRKKLADANAKFADDFLTKNGKQKGVLSMGESRLQYIVGDKGKGPKQPRPSDWVRVHYEGRLVEPGKDPKDYKLFESSRKNGKPLDAPIGSLMDGWKQALTQMKEGAKWTLWIPPEMAYDDVGKGRIIPPNAVLLFELELIKVLEKSEVDEIVQRIQAERERQQQAAEEEAVEEEEGK